MLFASHSRHQSKRWFWLMLLCVVSTSVSSLVIIGARAKNTWPNAAGAEEAPPKRNSQPGSGLRPEAASSVQLSAESVSVSEGAGFATVTVTRAGDTTGAASVDYVTLDGTAGQRTKFEIAAGTIKFAAGETIKSIAILINNNTYIDGNQTFYLQLSNAIGAGLGLPTLASITINDNSTPASTNLLEDAHEFIRQAYFDFLSRYPDQSGWDYWTGQITQCGANALCLHNKRIDASNAFFYELEYQQTASYVFRLYRAAYGNTQPFPNSDGSNQTEANKLPSYAAFVPDRARVVGGSSLAQSQQDVANAFAQRPEFLSRYAANLTLDQFVDTLLLNIKNDNGADLTLQRSALIALGSRGAVLYRLADDAQSNPINNRLFIDAEYNRAFVYSQYAGYLRRDADIGGFLFWLGQVNSAALRDVPKQHAMVCSFITSEEFQERFSPVSNRSNADCQINAPTGNHPPSVNAGVDQTISLPQNTATLSGLVTDDGLPSGGALTTQWSKAIGPGAVSFSNANLTTTMATFSAEGTYLLRLFASDSQLTNAAFVRVTVLPANVPPDPHDVAPPIDETVATNIYDATKFLYAGNPPIQTGVAPGTIKPIQTAVLRGRVVARDGSPLPGVKIAILNHAEFGQTFSRADGMFDMVVNGGGLLTVSYTKDGYLPLQRQMNVTWQDYSMVHDVSMIPFDPNVTTIDLSSNTPIQVARGGKVIDSPVPRQSTLLFKQGTTATMTLPGGGTQPLTTLHVRATEYTVGQMGPMAMPGDLPATSFYTYASEYSIDEAVAANATSISFNQPVVQYNENFLNFPVGTVIPSGSYEKTSGVWMPSDNGIVIKILSITSGVANLDIDGSGNPASDSALNALGINTAERQQLASLYAVGQSLWRVPLNHFSSWDSNWGFGPPPDAQPPSLPPPGPPPPPDDPDTCPGCIVGVENQTLGEKVNVTGSSFFLRYNSDRQVGNKGAYTTTITLSGASVPASLKRIELQIIIAGRVFAQVFPANANQSTVFTWDGKDAYGRTMQGQAFANIDIGYVYDGVYEQTSRFGYNGNGTPITGDRARREVTLHTIQKIKLGTYDMRALALGGWSLSAHHVYDPVGKVLYRGDGERRSSVQTINNVITRFAGTGADGSTGDGGPATNATFHFGPTGVAAGADGTVYIVDQGNQRIRKVGPDGIISTLGTDFTSPANNPNRIQIERDGNLLVNAGNNFIIRVNPSTGARTIIAGTGQTGFAGDDGPASQALFSSNPRPFPAPDGSIYIADILNNRVRKIGTDGIIRTVAGNGQQNFSGDGGPATAAALNNPTELTIAPDGSFYIMDTGNLRIRKVGADGMITTTAGTGLAGDTGDGGPALLARFDFGIFFGFDVLNKSSMALGPDGSLYIDQGNTRIRRIGPDGTVSAFAGNGQFNFVGTGDGGPATAASGSITAINVGQDGGIYQTSACDVSLNCGNVVRRIGSVLPGFSALDIAIPSEDGSELYKFDGNGRHLSTVNTFTGATVFTFTYDSAGHLIQVKDGDNNITTIERDGSGNATGILSPYNQRTLLGLDGNGYLNRVTDPLNNFYQFGYTAAGLMTSETDPRGKIYNFTYDALGRLTRDDDPANGFQTLARTDQDQTTFSVAHNTALGRLSSFLVQNLSTGSRRRLTTLTNGLQTELVEGANGVNTFRTPDGMVETETLGADPRFSMRAPIATSGSRATPGGLNFNFTFARAVVLSNPGDLLSLVSQTDTLNINGRTYTNAYAAANKTFTLTTPVGRQGTRTIDSLGRTTQTQFANLNATVRTYDARGRLATSTSGSGAEARATNYAYNTAGFLASMTDPLGRTESYVYDAAGRITQQTLRDGRIISFTYDASGNLTSLTPPGRPAPSFTFTPVNLGASYTAPSVGGNSQTTYAYNLDRQLTTITRPDAQVLNFTYDTSGRLSALTIPGGQYSYAYSATTGNVTGITAPGGGTLSYSYDGFLPTGTTWAGAVAGSVSRTFDNDFRIASQSVNGGNTVNFTYDNDSLLTTAGSLILTRNAQNGFVTGTALGNVTDVIGYNNFAESTSYNAKYNNSTTLYGVQYTRDKLGRITQKTETIGGATNIFAYTYDQAGRLSTVTLNGAGTPFVTYAYDSNSNRLSATYNGTPINATYDAQDRLTQYGVFTYAYTANGELQSRTMSGQTTTYNYDVLGNLKGVTAPGGPQIDYLIDGQDRRVGKKVSGTLTQGFLYDDQLDIVAELDGSNNIVSRFVYGTRANVPDYMIKGGVTYRIISDTLGSPRLVVDVNTGTVAQEVDYDEFGVVLTDTNPGFQPFGFAGGLYDKDTGLVRFGARDYDAQTGRWTAKDPIMFAGGDTNLYGYVLNDPINFRDQNGTEVQNSSSGFIPYPKPKPKPDPIIVCEPKKKGPRIINLNADDGAVTINIKGKGPVTIIINGK